MQYISNCKPRVIPLTFTGHQTGSALCSLRDKKKSVGVGYA